MKKLILGTALTLASLFGMQAQAAEYDIDVDGSHASIQFKIKHLGYSWLLGRFNEFNGEFNYDSAALEKSSISVEIDTASIDSNHAERDKHLRGKGFLEVKKFPKASFKSTRFDMQDDNTAIVTGLFTLHGVEKEISFPIQKIGEGKDPWGGYRAGFEGKTTLKLSDYGITYNLGPASTHIDIELYLEGLRR